MASPSPADSDVLAWRVLLWWFADQVIATLPPLGDEVCYLVVDSTLKDKTGQKHLLAKKGRLNEYAPDIFGLHIVVVMLQWGNYRIPIDFEMVRRKGHPHYRSESRLLRWMLVRLQRPSWAEMVIVVADAAFASKANIQLIRQRGYFFVMAFARTWCFDNGQALKALVTHLPKNHDRRCWVPQDEPGRRRTYWTSTKRARLRHIGEVTIMLSQKRRNDGPNTTNILVTTLPDMTARQVVDVYRQRWTVEQFIKDSKQLLGLGQYQNRPSWAAVTPRHLVCFASALLTHLRIERYGAQGQRTRKKAAELSTAAAQDQLRRLFWEDLLTYLREKPRGQPIIEELERLRVA